LVRHTRRRDPVYPQGATRAELPTDDPRLGGRRGVAAHLVAAGRRAERLDAEAVLRLVDRRRVAAEAVTGGPQALAARAEPTLRTRAVAAPAELRIGVGVGTNIAAALVLRRAVARALGADLRRGAGF